MRCANFVDGADVGMVERGGSASFAAKTFQGLCIAGEFVRQELQSDETAEFGVFGFVDDAHSATAEFFDDAVMRNCLAEQGFGFAH